jgi:putative membrane protein
LLWLPPALWVSVKYYQSWHWFVSEEGILAKWGVINRTSVLLQWYKVQAVAIRQSVFLRRFGLAHLTLYTAAGEVSLPYIPMEKAQAVQNFVLYKIETDRRDWM